jgi:hypothetical protein
MLSVLMTDGYTDPLQGRRRARQRRIAPLFRPDRAWHLVRQSRHVRIVGKVRNELRDFDAEEHSGAPGRAEAKPPVVARIATLADWP